MKIVVIGGSGLIGTQAREQPSRARPRGRGGVALVGRQHPHRRGTGRGACGRAGRRRRGELAVVRGRGGAGVLRDVGRNLLAAEAAAGVGHHVALSVVGADRLPESGYMRAKVAQEKLIKAGRFRTRSSAPRSSSSSSGGIAQSGDGGQTVRLPPALMQPIVSDDVAAALADVAVGEPRNGTIELAGPEPIRMDELVRRFLSAKRDERR